MYISISDKKIYINVWDSVVNPKGLVQVVHGMAEYGERYNDLAKFLNERGYIVIASDHFGHKNSINNFYGEMGVDGFQSYVDDELFINRYFKEKYEIPIHIIGHSMGSFIAQYFMAKDLENISSYTFVGSCYQRTPKVFAGNKLIKLIASLRQVKEDKFIDKLMFGNFNNRFEKKTPFDWLSKNELNVHTYINDPHCGVLYPTNFYKNFVEAMWNLHKNENFKFMKHKKPILIISGNDDPVGEFGKGVEKLVNFYKKNDFSVEMKLYEMLRHELLNEDIKEEIFNKIFIFIDKN